MVALIAVAAFVVIFVLATIVASFWAAPHKEGESMWKSLHNRQKW